MTSRTWLGRLLAVALATASVMLVAGQPASASGSAEGSPTASASALAQSTPAASLPALASASASGGDVGPMIIGGNDATESYPFAARLLTTYAGVGVARCTADFVKNRRGRIGVVTNAHCVSRLDSGEAMPASTVQVQAGSTHLDQLTTIPADQVDVHPGWDWGTGDDAFADVAVVNVTIPAGLHVNAIPIGKWAHVNQQVRLLGWGKTTYDATVPPPVLQQLDTHLLARSACAAAAISDGEICVAPAANSGQACFGDSGGPALSRRGTWWVLLGSASRLADESNCTGPAVYTNATYYADWIDQALTGARLPHQPRHVAPDAAKRYWALAA